jgi:single-strand DNA-binding protein
MSQNIKGTLEAIFEVQIFASGFQKREFLIKTEEQYPQVIKLELTKDKCSILDAFKQGQQVSVDFNLRGSEYNGKHYVNLTAWRVSANSEDGVANTATEARVNAIPKVLEDIDSDNLPF